MARVITTSPNLETVPPENTGVDNHTIITSPAQYANWAALFAAKPPAPGYQYQFLKGDYRSWGPQTFTNAFAAGVAGNRIMIRYAGDQKELHPVDRKAAANEAVFDSIRWTGAAQRSWMTHGLTWRGPTVDQDINNVIGDIVQDFFLIEDSSRGYGQRIRSGTGNVLQRGVIRNSLDFGSGAGDLAIQVVPQDAPVTGTKILGMEVYDWGDGFQASDNASDMYMATDGLIEDCDFYVTAARQGLSENAMDFKSGSDTTSWIVRRCNLFGFRAGAESTGQLITIHNGARNIVWEDCNLGDAPFGLHVVAWDADDLPPGGLGQDTPRNLIMRRCWFHDIRGDEIGEGSGSALRTINNERFEDCVIGRCDALEYANVLVVHAGGPTYSRIRRVLPTLPHHPDSASQHYSDEGNFVLPEPDIHRYDTYQRKRWTGIETVEGPAPSPVRGMIVRTGGFGARRGSGSGMTVHTP